MQQTHSISRTGALVFALASLVLFGCESRTLAPGPGESLDPANLPPENVGAPLEGTKAVGYSSPQIEIDRSIIGKDREDLQLLVDSAIALLVRPELAQTGRAISVDNPQVHLRDDLRKRSSEEVAALLSTPPAGWSYLKTRLIVGTGGAVTGPNTQNTPHALRIRIQEDRLRLWRSNNAVARSCALNTTAHEISHTLVTSTTQFRPAFTDTGAGSHVDQTFASYLSGNMVQCTFLKLSGRIEEGGLGRCVPVWTAWNRRTSHVAFQRGRCDQFNETDPVQWPKVTRP